jgi:hypothetical protein
MHFIEIALPANNGPLLWCGCVGNLRKIDCRLKMFAMTRDLKGRWNRSIPAVEVVWYPQLTCGFLVCGRPWRSNGRVVGRLVAVVSSKTVGQISKVVKVWDEC